MNEGERTGVFLDALNLAYTYRNMPNGRARNHIVDYRGILKDCKKGRNVVKAIAYSGQGRFFSDLNRLLAWANFEVKEKEEHVGHDGRRKCNWDVGIAIDAIRMAPKLDTVVLLSGDVDFIDLVRPLREECLCKVELWSFRRFTHRRLLSAVNTFVELDPDRYLIKVP